MYLALHNVHQPVEAPPEFLNMYPESQYNESTMPRRYYNAMTFSVDQVIQNVTNALKQYNMYNNSVIIISTDNGGTYEHSGAVPGSSNYPLRGYKYSYFEGGIRGFAMVVSPLIPKSKKGTTSKKLLAIYDWYVTFCKLAGIDNCDGNIDELSKDAPLDGIDAWKVLVGGEVMMTTTRRQIKINNLSIDHQVVGLIEEVQVQMNCYWVLDMVQKAHYDKVI